MRLKPVPKFILIAIIVGSIGYGINIMLNKRKASEAVIASQTEAVPVPAPIEADPVPTETPVSKPSAMQSMDSDSAPAANAGLAKLLNSKK